MKILFDHQIFMLHQYSGISRYFYEIARHLSKEESCNISIFAPLYVNIYLEYLSKSQKMLVRGKKIEFPVFLGSSIRRINSLLTKIFVKPRRDIDIYHETYFTYDDNCPKAAKRIVTIHDMIYEKFPQYFPKQATTAQRKAFAVYRADHIICVSENTRRDLINILEVPEKKISVIYHGYKLSSLTTTDFRIQFSKPFFLYIGSRFGYKNFDLLLKAFSSSKTLKNESRIICFGGGQPTKKEKCMITNLRIPSDRILFLQGNDSILLKLYSNATALIYPSLYEGFGIPPLEAMSFGCPVICSNTSSLPEVVGDAAHFIDPQSESDLRNAMELFLNSSKYISILKAKGHERIKQFSWKKCAKNTLKIYKKLLA